MKNLVLKRIFTYAIGSLIVIMMLLGMIACSSEEEIVDEVQTTSSSVAEVPPAPQPEILAYKVNEDGKTCTITGKGTCTSSNLVIPPTIDGYKVTAIGTFALNNFSVPTSVTIPDSVTTIEKNAFYFSRNLISVEIPNTVTSIGWGAFQGCTGLKNLVIPNSVESIDLYAFAECDNLESITLPFTGTGSLGINDNFGAVFGSSQLLQNAYVPENLKTVIITDRVFTGAFRYLENIECVVLPDDITKIPGYLFAGCKSLKSVTIPDSVTEIGYSAFEECTSLKSIILPAGVTEIHSLAFYKCPFKSIVLPASLTYIEDRVFSNCRSLSTITFEGTVAQWNAIEIDDNPYQEWNVMTSATEVVCSDGVVKLK